MRLTIGDSDGDQLKERFCTFLEELTMPAEMSQHEAESLLSEIGDQKLDDRVMDSLTAKLDARLNGTRTRVVDLSLTAAFIVCLLYTSPSPRDQRGSRMPSSA